MPEERKWPQVGDRGYICADEQEMVDVLHGHDELPERPEEVIEHVILIEPPARESDRSQIRFVNITNPWKGGDTLVVGRFDLKDPSFSIVKQTPAEAMRDMAESIEEYAARCVEYAKLLRRWAEAGTSP